MVKKAAGIAVAVLTLAWSSLNGWAAQPPEPTTPAPTEASGTSEAKPPETAGAKTDPADPEPTTKDKEEAKRAIAEDRAAQQEFAGIEFGAALVVLVALSDESHIEDAQLAGPEGEQIVRITKRTRSTARLALETHLFLINLERYDCEKPEQLNDNERDAKLKVPCDVQLGFGPFLMVQPDDQDLITAIGGGAMVGLRKTGKSQSFNLGLGVALEPKVKSLGAGLDINGPLPAGETTIRFRETSRWSLLFLASFAF